MKELFEFYEMANLNAAALCVSEQSALLEARRGLRLFARAMERLKISSAEFDATVEFTRLAA